MKEHGYYSDSGIRSCLFWWPILGALLFSGVSLSAKSVILPVEAIDESAELTAEEFNNLYPGIDVSGYLPDEEGYYVEYTHENLTYYFGPVDQYEEAIKWKEKLLAIREAVISTRLTLQKSEVRIYHFNHEMLAQARAEIERRQAAAGNWQTGVASEGYEATGESGEQGREGDLVIVDRESGEKGQKSGLFGRDSEELSEVRQKSQQGAPGQAGKQGEGQQLQIVQAGQQNQQGGMQLPQIGQQSRQGQQASNSRTSRSSNSSSSSSSSNSSSASSSGSSGGGPPVPGGSGQPKKGLSWWEIVRRTLFGN